MHRETAVAHRQPPHFEPDPDIADLEHIGAAVVFDRVALYRIDSRAQASTSGRTRWTSSMSVVRGDLRIAGLSSIFGSFVPSVLIVQLIGLPSVIGSMR